LAEERKSSQLRGLEDENDYSRGPGKQAGITEKKGGGSPASFLTRFDRTLPGLRSAAAWSGAA